eukprot:1004076-Rhodomonas_salina.5
MAELLPCRPGASHVRPFDCSKTIIFQKLTACLQRLQPGTILHSPPLQRVRSIRNQALRSVDGDARCCRLMVMHREKLTRQGVVFVCRWLRNDKRHLCQKNPEAIARMENPMTKIPHQGVY